MLIFFLSLPFSWDAESKSEHELWIMDGVQWQRGKWLQLSLLLFLPSAQHQWLSLGPGLLAPGHCSCPFRGNLWGSDWVPDNTQLEDLKAQFEIAPDPHHFYSHKIVRKSYLSLAVYSKDPFKNSVVQERGVGVGKWGEKAVIDCFILLRKTKLSILWARSWWPKLCVSHWLKAEIFKHDIFSMVLSFSQDEIIK